MRTAYDAARRKANENRAQSKCWRNLVASLALV
jgi:hypothetical protein